MFPPLTALELENLDADGGATTVRALTAPDSAGQGS